MSYAPGDNFNVSFGVEDDTGAGVNADALPAATLRRNGADDVTVVVTVVNNGAGDYTASGTVPIGYAIGDDVELKVRATVATVVLAPAFLHMGQLATPAPANFAALGISVTGVADAQVKGIDANAITAASIAAAALNGKGNWSTYAGGDTAGTATLLTRNTEARLAKLDVAGTLAHTDNASLFKADVSGIVATQTAHGTTLTAVKGTTDKLDPLIVGGAYTAAALVNSPAGGGGGTNNMTIEIRDTQAS